MDLPTLSTKIVNDTNSLISNLNSADANHNYRRVTRPIGVIDGLEYHCVVIGAGRSEYLEGTPWQRVIDSVITWANRHGNDEMVVYYVDMDTYASPMVRIGTLSEPEEPFVLECKIIEEKP